MRLTKNGANRYKKGSWGAPVVRPEDLVEEMGLWSTGLWARSGSVGSRER